MGCEGYDFPEDPYILKDSCQLIYSLSGPRRSSGSGSGAGGSARYSRQWEDGNNPTWDGRATGGSHSGGVGTERSFGSRLVAWAVLGVVGYAMYNMLVRAAAPPTGGESRTSYPHVLWNSLQ